MSKDYLLNQLLTLEKNQKILIKTLKYQRKINILYGLVLLFILIIIIL